ncbi:MAG TPA: hypothetical protein VM285_15180, partial [Polyangia bacterium]|nr:hypothetical protein [Polyangia bacterium]
ERMSSGHGRNPCWKEIAALAVAVAVGFVSGPARAGEDDAALEQAFFAGLGDQPAPGNGRLIVRRAGTSVELGADGDELRLTCLLCSPVEQAVRARELGARLALGGDRAEDGGGPGLRATDLPAQGTGRGSPRLPILLGGAGVALAAAGTVLLLFDGDCASTRRDTAGNCAALHDLAPAGWSLAATGAAAVVTAVLIWILGGTGPAETGAEVAR